MILLTDVLYLETLSQNAVTCARLKPLSKGMTRHGTHEIFGGTFLHTAPFRWWSSIGGVNLGFHNINAPFTLQSNMQNVFRLLSTFVRLFITIILWLRRWRTKKNNNTVQTHLDHSLCSLPTINDNGFTW